MQAVKLRIRKIVPATDADGFFAVSGAELSDNVDTRKRLIGLGAVCELYKAGGDGRYWDVGSDDLLEKFYECRGYVLRQLNGGQWPRNIGAMAKGLGSEEDMAKKLVYCISNVYEAVYRLPKGSLSNAAVAAIAELLLWRRSKNDTASVVYLKPDKDGIASMPSHLRNGLKRVFSELYREDYDLSITKFDPPKAGYAKDPNSRYRMGPFDECALLCPKKNKAEAERIIGVLLGDANAYAVLSSNSRLLPSSLVFYSEETDPKKIEAEAIKLADALKKRGAEIVEAKYDDAPLFSYHDASEWYWDLSWR